MPKLPRINAPRGNTSLRRTRDPGKQKVQAEKVMSALDALQPELRSLVQELGYGPVDAALIRVVGAPLNSLSKAGRFLSKDELRKVSARAREEMLSQHRADMNPGALFE